MWLRFCHLVVIVVISLYSYGFSISQKLLVEERKLSRKSFSENQNYKMS